MDKSELTTDLRSPAEIKAACCEAVNGGPAGVDEARDRVTLRMVNAVLDTIIAHSQSPRTVDELTLIRGAGE